MSGQHQWNHGAMKALVVAAGCAVGGTAQAGSFDLFGIDGNYQLLGTYSAAWRMEKPGDGIINTPPSPEIPIPDFLKLPESNNFDDGDRNFKRGSMVNNRVSLLGEFQLQYEDFGLLVRGDAFYDGVYYDTNDNRSLLTMNRTDGDPQFEPDTQVDAFSDIARYRSGRRARVLDAYVYGSWYLGESAALNVRLGRHIAAWGESLFMSGVALAQAPADATKATVPGADVKSILLPVNQLSMQLALTNELTLLGQYKLEFKPVELNPVGEFFSVTDVVGPGAQFIWGIKNPLYFPTLADINLLSGQTPEALQLIADLVGVGAPLQGVTGLLQDALDRLDPLLPDVGLPLDIIPQPNTPRYINVVRGNDKKPSDHGQWGLGLKYQVTPETNLGLYRLRYHNTTPAPIQNYGFATLLPGQNGLPPLTTEISRPWVSWL